MSMINENQSIIKNIQASGLLCKNFNSETNSIENIIDIIEVDKDLKARFHIYLQVKIFDENNYHLIVLFKSETKLRIIGELDIPEDKIEREKNKVINYKIVYNMNEFSFLNRGNYEMEIYAIEKNEFYINMNHKEGEVSIQELYSFLNTNASNLLDIVPFRVD